MEKRIEDRLKWLVEKGGYSLELARKIVVTEQQQEQKKAITDYAKADGVIYEQPTDSNPYCKAL